MSEQPKQPLVVPFLAGPRVHLQPFTENDLPILITWRNDARTRRWARTTFPQTLENEKKHFTEIAEMNTKSEGLMFAIWLNDDARLIGSVSLNDIDWVNRNCRVGLVIGDKASWGQGIAGEVAGLIFDHAFGELSMHKIITGIGSPNARSNGAARKLDLTLVGHRDGEFFVDGEYIGNNVYEMLDRDWPAARQELNEPEGT